VAVCRQGGALIHYQDSRAGAPGGRDLHLPAVLLVHGGIHERMDARRFWVEPGVAGAVAAAGYRVPLPDRRWSGGATVAPVRSTPGRWRARTSRRCSGTPARRASCCPGARRTAPACSPAARVREAGRRPGGDASGCLGRSLLAGETVRGATDQELRSLRGSGLGVAVIAPAGDGPVHIKAVAERLAKLASARPPSPDFPETPRPEFTNVREPFLATLLALLGAMSEHERDAVGRRAWGAGEPAGDKDQRAGARPAVRPGPSAGTRGPDAVVRRAGDAGASASGGASAAVSGSPAAAGADEPGEDEYPEQ
jgi:hypothetical protein